MSVATEVEEITGAKVRRTVLLDNAVLMRLHFARFGTSRKVESSQVEVDTDKRLLRVTKKILDSPEGDEVAKLDGKIRQWVHSQCLPSTFMDGVLFVPLAKVREINDRMKEFSSERYVAVEVLCDAFERIYAQDRERLKDLFNAAEYPTVDEIRRAYSVDWTFMALTAPKSLEAVSEELYMSAKQKMENNIAEATEAVRMVLRAQFKDLVDHLAERLTPAEDGKKKIFRQSMTDKFQEFLSSFSDRNITEDGELERLVEQARGLMGGVDPDSLRTEESLRDSIRSGIEAVKASLDEMVQAEPVRRINVDLLPVE